MTQEEIIKQLQARITELEAQLAHTQAILDQTEADDAHYETLLDERKARIEVLEKQLTIDLTKRIEALEEDYRARQGDGR